MTKEADLKDIEEETSWDGWKTLLLGDPNYREPVLNADPNYIATPPSVLVTTISVKGEVSLTFTEDVWVIEDLKNATFPKQLSRGRGLQDVEYVPYIDVSIEPGDPTLEGFEPDKLLFDYDAEFTDSRTIEISISFVSPVYVSAI